MYQVLERNTPWQAFVNAGGNVIHLRELLQDDGLAAVFVSLGDIDGVSKFSGGDRSLYPFCAAIHRTTPND